MFIIMVGGTLETVEDLLDINQGEIEAEVPRIMAGMYWVAI